jgi:hypothetical protein
MKLEFLLTTKWTQQTITINTSTVHADEIAELKQKKPRTH